MPAELTEGSPNIAEKLRTAMVRAIQMGDVYFLEVEILIQLLSVNLLASQFKRRINERSRLLVSLK